MGQASGGKACAHLPDRRVLLLAAGLGGLGFWAPPALGNGRAEAGLSGNPSRGLTSCLRAIAAAHGLELGQLSVMVVVSPAMMGDVSDSGLVRLSSGFVAACGGPARVGAWFSQALANRTNKGSSSDRDEHALRAFVRAGYDPRLIVALWQDWSASPALTRLGPRGDWPLSEARRTALAARVTSLGYLL